MNPALLVFLPLAILACWLIRMGARRHDRPKNSGQTKRAWEEL